MPWSERSHSTWTSSTCFSFCCGLQETGVTSESRKSQIVNREKLNTAFLLRNQEQLSLGFSAFEVAMGLLRLLERISFMYAQFQIAANNHLQNIAGTLFQFLARGDIMLETGARDEE